MPCAARGEATSSRSHTVSMPALTISRAIAARHAREFVSAEARGAPVASGRRIAIVGLSRIKKPPRFHLPKQADVLIQKKPEPSLVAEDHIFLAGEKCSGGARSRSNAAADKGSFGSSG